jgi:hypothetical protein
MECWRSTTCPENTSRGDKSELCSRSIAVISGLCDQLPVKQSFLLPIGTIKRKFVAASWPMEGPLHSLNLFRIKFPAACGVALMDERIHSQEPQCDGIAVSLGISGKVSMIDEHVDEVLKEICLEIENRYQVKFLEIGTDKDHVHFLVQSVPTYSVTQIVMLVKSLTGGRYSVVVLM